MKKKQKYKIDKVPIALHFNSNSDWRFETPKVDRDKCIKCGVCYLYCPDSAISETNEGYFEADLNLCKGCALCQKQCVTGCIAMEMDKSVPRHPLFK